MLHVSTSRLARSEVFKEILCALLEGLISTDYRIQATKLTLRLRAVLDWKKTLKLSKHGVLNVCFQASCWSCLASLACKSDLRA